MASYVFDVATGTYRSPAGAVVAPEAISAALEQVITAGQARIAVHAHRLADGTSDLLAFRTAVQAELRIGHVAAGMAAHGGKDAMDASTRGFLGAQIRTQNSYLSNLALDWAQGRMSPAQLNARMAMYPEAFHSTFEAVRRRDAPGRGFDQERNILGSGKPCAGCLAETARGFVPVGTLSAPGSRQCVSRCRCRLIYRNSQVEAVA